MLKLHFTSHYFSKEYFNVTQTANQGIKPINAPAYLTPRPIF